jgi:RecB family endonuclease NucS
MESPKRQIILENPRLNKAVHIIKSGISRHRTVVIAGKCVVDYEGRANSRLEEGERLVIIKPDGSALVHRPRDYSPVNWQPSGSIFNTKLVNESLLIRVYRRKEKESMVITFSELLMVSILDMIDNSEFYLYASEKDMQEAILFKPDLLEKGFRPITKEMTVAPGFVDIIGYDNNNTLTVVEIKRVKANKKAVEQLKKYMEVIDLDKNRKVRAILVAPEITNNAKKLLNTLGYEFKILSPQECSEILKQKKRTSLKSFFIP